MVGEGIETCLAAMQARGLPAWAALSTSGVLALELPDEVHDVIVLADGDDAGEAAARGAALRWKREGRRVRIAYPPQGMDFNDMLLGSAPKTRGDCNDRRSRSHRSRRGGRRRHRCGRRNPRSAGGPGGKGRHGPWCAFAPEVLERLAMLKSRDRAAFETLRAQLKQAGCRVTELDKVLTDESGDQEGCAPKQADILISWQRAPSFPCS